MQLPQLFLYIPERSHHRAVLHECYPSYFFLTFLCSYSPFLNSSSKKLLGGIAFTHFFISYLLHNLFINKSACSFFSPLCPGLSPLPPPPRGFCNHLITSQLSWSPCPTNANTSLNAFTESLAWHWPRMALVFISLYLEVANSLSHKLNISW